MRNMLRKHDAGNRRTKDIYLLILTLEESIAVWSPQKKILLNIWTALLDILSDMSEPRLRGYKTFFMLNSAEHEICHANKSQITNNCTFFLAKHIVGIFIFISWEDFKFSWVERGKKFYNLEARFMVYNHC